MKMLFIDYFMKQFKPKIYNLKFVKRILLLLFLISYILPLYKKNKFHKWFGIDQLQKAKNHILPGRHKA